VDQGKQNFTVTVTHLLTVSEITMIVYFAITHEHGRTSLKGLHTSLGQVINSEAVKIHTTFTNCFRLIRIGTTVRKEVGRNFYFFTEEG
jgi:hypothetical protein